MRKIVKDSATLIGGNVWAQAISLLAYVLLTRIFTPDQFGIYNVFYSYIEVLIILSTCKYEMAVVRADTDREATAVARFALRLNTWVSLFLITAIGVLLLFHALPGKSNTLGLIALLIPVMVFFCGTTRVYAALFNRFKDFRPIAVSEVVTATSGILFKIGLGLLQLTELALGKVCGLLGLPLGTVLGKMAGNINYLVRLKTLSLPKDVGREERRQAAAKHRNFALYTMPKDLVNSFSYNLPLLWLALYFDKAEVGLFALALTFCVRPVNVLNSAFERIFYVRTMEKVRNHQSVWPDLWRFVGGISAVALPLLVLVFAFAEPIFGFCFGERWTGCAFYVRCLLPWVFIMISSTSLSFIAGVFNKQRSEFFFFIVLLLLRVAAMLFGIGQHDFKIAILFFSLAGVAVSLALLLWYFILVGKYEKSIA
jgi:lipopolysaccharide exporter